MSQTFEERRAAFRAETARILAEMRESHEEGNRRSRYDVGRREMPNVIRDGKPYVVGSGAELLTYADRMARVGATDRTEQERMIEHLGQALYDAYHKIETLEKTQETLGNLAAIPVSD